MLEHAHELSCLCLLATLFVKNTFVWIGGWGGCYDQLCCPASPKLLLGLDLGLGCDNSAVSRQGSNHNLVIVWVNGTMILTELRILPFGSSGTNWQVWGVPHFWLIHTGAIAALWFKMLVGWLIWSSHIKDAVSAFRQGDLISRPCLSICLYVRIYVCLSFLIFQKRGFEIANSNLSNTTKLILLDSLLQEVTPGEI